MRRMSVSIACRIAARYDDLSEVSEDELTEYIDALEYLMANGIQAPDAWIYNLASAYDSIGKYELALKYYQMSIAQGGSAVTSDQVKPICTCVSIRRHMNVMKKL